LSELNIWVAHFKEFLEYYSKRKEEKEVEPWSRGKSGFVGESRKTFASF